MEQFIPGSIKPTSPQGPNQTGQLETDILIIGAGIAGCTAAIALSDAYRVILIDRLAEPVDRIGESLAPAAIRILKKLQLWEDLRREADSSIFIQSHGMESYWGQDRVRIVDHLTNPDGFVLNLDRKAFEVFLRKKVLERGVLGLWPSIYESSSYDHGCWVVTTGPVPGLSHDSAYHIKAKFIIDASGRPSRFVRSRRLFRKQFDKLISCWALVTDYTEKRMSTITATENGWWYSAVVPGSRRVIAYQTDPDLIDRKSFTRLPAFLSALRESPIINDLLDKIDGQIEYHGIVGANSSRLHQLYGTQWVAIGDAAMSFDPLSAQGMFHAMASAMQLGDLLTRRDGIWITDEKYLRNLQSQYSTQMDRVWEQYRYHHNLYYGAEQRWGDCPFWRRRHSFSII